MVATGTDNSRVTPISICPYLEIVLFVVGVMSGEHGGSSAFTFVVSPNYLYKRRQ